MVLELVMMFGTKPSSQVKKLFNCSPWCCCECTTHFLLWIFQKRPARILTQLSVTVLWLLCRIFHWIPGYKALKHITEPFLFSHFSSRSHLFCLLTFNLPNTSY
jgi:hypothetical protein